MNLEVHFTMKGIPGSLTHIIQVESMDDQEIKKVLVEEVKHHLNFNNEHMNQIILTIFFIKELPTK